MVGNFFFLFTLWWQSVCLCRTLQNFYLFLQKSSADVFWFESWRMLRENVSELSGSCQAVDSYHQDVVSYHILPYINLFVYSSSLLWDRQTLGLPRYTSFNILFLIYLFHYLRPQLFKDSQQHINQQHLLEYCLQSNIIRSVNVQLDILQSTAQ